MDKLWSICSDKLEAAYMDLNNLNCTLWLATEGANISCGKEAVGLLQLSTNVIQNVRALLDEAMTAIRAAKYREEEQKQA